MPPWMQHQESTNSMRESYLGSWFAMIGASRSQLTTVSDCEGSHLNRMRNQLAANPQLSALTGGED